MKLVKIMILSRVTICFLILLSLTSCISGTPFDPKNNDHIDRRLQLNRDDYRNINLSKLKAQMLIAEKKGGVKITAHTNIPKIPSIAPILAAPRPPKIGQNRLVSITVTDDVELKDVLMELARLANVDIEIDSGIHGGISFRAKDKPFSEVIERIAGLAGLRYSMHNGSLRIERDTNFVRNYSIDFLNLVRSSDSQVSISTDVLALASSGSSGGGSSGGGSSGGGSSGGGSSGGSGLNTGSSSKISAKSEDDFWKSLGDNLKKIIANKATNKLSVNSEGDDKKKIASAEDSTNNNGFFVINRRAGVITVSANHLQHKAIKNYLDLLERNVSAQVLIEAKIVEVSLDNRYRSGVNWDSIKNDLNINLNFSPEFSANNVVTLAAGRGGAGVALTDMVRLTEKFGTTRTLSSPRLHAVNNQQAVLTFAENRVFFEINMERSDAQSINGQLIPGTTTITSTRRSVPIGLILNIMPSINLEKNEVTLSVRPTLSRQVATVVDPGSALINQQLLDSNPNATGFVNEVPIVEVREMDSILKIKSGQVMVIGGLMEQTSANTDEGMPFVSEVPWLGNLFKGVDKNDKIKELIIFIRATIVNTDGNYSPADKEIYQKFTEDPRPIAF